MLLSSQSLREKEPILSDKKRVIHKNESYEKFRNLRISRENSDLVQRLVRTSCEIIKAKTTEKSFNRHLKYK